jgi:hypothetical protein
MEAIAAPTSWETSTVVIGVRIHAVAVAETDGNVFYSNANKLYYLLDDDASFELYGVGDAMMLIGITAAANGVTVFAIANDGGVYRFPISKTRKSVNVDETVKALMGGSWRIGAVRDGRALKLFQSDTAIVVTRTNFTSVMIFLSNLTMKATLYNSSADSADFSIADGGRVIMRSGTGLVAGALQKSGWRDGIPGISLLARATQIAFDRLSGALYVADMNNGLRRIIRAAASGAKDLRGYYYAPIPYARVLSFQPQEDASGDWYGYPAPNSFSWDDIFRAESMVMYSLLPSKIAPIVTMTRFSGGWGIDRSFLVQPRRIMPGIWFPCNASCQNTVASFAPATATDGWHSIRIEAYMNNGLTLDASARMDMDTVAGPPRLKMSSLPPVEAYTGTLGNQ